MDNNSSNSNTNTNTNTNTNSNTNTNKNFDKINESTNKINKLYDGLHYFDLYGGSVIFFIILFIILFLIHSYTNVMVNIKPIQDNWAAERCSPKVIPFAGFIAKPDNISAIDFTRDNFTFCMQQVLTSITGEALEPLTFITSGLTTIYGDIADALNDIRGIISNVRTNVEKIVKEIMGRVLNIMAPIQVMLIAFRDTLQKIQGIFAAGIYTSIGVYDTLKSVLGATLQLIVMVLIILAGIIIGLWIIPFTWPFAIANTLIFTSISIPLIIILVFMSNVLHININSPIPAIPGPGHCFDKNTRLLLNNGTYKTIENICVGEKLKNNNTVTAKFKLDARNVEMFNFKNIIISGSHRVFYNNSWIYIKDHPISKRVINSNFNDEYIYCLNTDLKTIEIDNDLFSDWDEIFDEEKRELLGHLEVDVNDTENIHKYYDGGFFSNTEIRLQNSGIKEIKNINVGDILENGEIVYGIVEISSENINCNYNYNCNNGINLQPIFYTLTNLEKTGNKKSGEKIYHLLTNTKYFSVNGIKYYHYNSCVELFLEKYKKNLLSIKYV